MRCENSKCKSRWHCRCRCHRRCQVNVKHKLHCTAFHSFIHAMDNIDRPSLQVGHTQTQAAGVVVALPWQTQVVPLVTQRWKPLRRQQGCLPQTFKCCGRRLQTRPGPWNSGATSTLSTLLDTEVHKCILAGAVW